VSEAPSTNGSVEVGKANELNDRITVQKRAPGGLQTVKDAVVYIILLPAPSPAVLSQSVPASILGELRAHLSVLRTNTAATLILVVRFPPEPGTVDSDVEAMARLRDLSRLQLTNEREMEMEETVEMVNSVHDSIGCLVVVDKLRSRNTATVALAVKYQARTERHHEIGPTII